MKKLLPLFLVLLCFSENAISATRKRSTRRTSSASKTVTYTTPTQDQCNIDIDYCFSRYCFDKKTLNEGVYSKCGAEPASTILVNVEDCLATRAVIKQLDLQNGCKTYSYDRIVSLLNSKGTIETGLKKNSTECAKATRALQAAKKCYAAMISSDGSSSVELYDELDSLCGFEASGDSYMLNRFYQAGDYGDSNVGALEDLRLTGQNTQKRENWRQVVDATLAGYTEMAELACGAEDYKLTKVNEYDLDSHSNSQMIALEAEAKAIGKQSADKVVNQWFRESDCVNSPLPVGGLYWSYKKGGNPDCRIVCKEGYFVGRNSSTCVKAQDDKQETFIGLNIGNNWIGEKKVVDEEPTPTPTPTPTPAPKPTPVVDTCPKLSVAKTNWSPKSKGKDGVCDIFFPRREDGTCEYKYYCRHTGSDGEWFNIGDAKGKYTSWYDMKLSNDNGMDLNSIFEKNHPRFGDEYSEYLSKDIKDYCLNDRRCKGEAPKGDKVEAKCSDVPTGETGNISGWKRFVEKYVTSTGDCRWDYDNVKTTLGEWNDQTRWSLDSALSTNMKEYRNCLCQSDSTPSNDKCANKEATDSVKRWDWVEAWNACAPAECQSGYKLCDGGRDCCKVENNTTTEISCSDFSPIYSVDAPLDDWNLLMKKWVKWGDQCLPYDCSETFVFISNNCRNSDCICENSTSCNSNITLTRSEAIGNLSSLKECVEYVVSKNTKESDSFVFTEECDAVPPARSFERDNWNAYLKKYPMSCSKEKKKVSEAINGMGGNFHDKERKVQKCVCGWDKDGVAEKCAKNMKKNKELDVKCIYLAKSTCRKCMKDNGFSGGFMPSACSSICANEGFLNWNK